MLGANAKNISSMIATQLVKEGMLWGEELEWFIRQSVEGIINLDDSAMYDEFENEILELVEKRRKRIKVKNIRTNEILYFNSLKDVCEELKFNYSRVNDAIRKNILVYKKYSIQYERMSIKELTI